MKRYLAALVILLMAVTIFLNPKSIYKSYDSQINSDGRYHFIFIPKEKNDYWRLITESIVEEGKKNGISISVLEENYYDQETHLNLINKAIESKCDGIISYVANKEEYQKLIDKSIEKSIPFIVMDEDCLKSKRNSYIGTNHYKTGKLMAKKLAQDLNYTGNIGIVMNSTENSLRLTGIHDQMKEYPAMRIQSIAYMDETRANTYKIIEDMVLEKKYLNGIICNDEYSTYLAAQVLVRQNKVGQIKIIGVGDWSDILRFIKKDIISGVFKKNPYKMGSIAFETMMDIKKGSFVENAIFYELEYIEREDLDDEQ